MPKTNKKTNSPKLLINKEDNATYIFVGKYTIAVPYFASIGVAKRHPTDKTSKEIGKALAYYRMHKAVAEEFENEEEKKTLGF